MNACLHGAEGEAHHAGDLLVGESLDVPEDDGNAVLRRQPVQGAPHPARGLVSQELGAGGVRVPLAGGCGPVVGRLQRKQSAGPPSPAPELLPGQVGGDGVDPEEDLLGQVPGPVPFPDDAAHVVGDGRLVAGHQHLERSLVSLSDGLHKWLVARHFLSSGLSGHRPGKRNRPIHPSVPLTH